MRSQADAACELPWLAPSASSLVALTREPDGGVWPSLRADPGLVLLVVRQIPQCGVASSFSFYPTLLYDPGILDLALDCLGRPQHAFVDWNQPKLALTYQAALGCALAAEAIAKHTERCDADHAWVGGLLAPLGWLASAVNAADGQWTVSGKVVAGESPATVHRPLSTAASIGRRLATAWRLPPWLNAVAGHLGLPLDAARGLGADADHFLVVQLAALVVEQAGLGTWFAVGTSRAELLEKLQLTTKDMQQFTDHVQRSLASRLSSACWQAPASLPLLPELLGLAAKNRRAIQHAERTRLHGEVDSLHDFVEHQRASETQRLQEMKLESLAELAAGAGHEINNPLAVISGQAQYLLTAEQEPARRKSLQTIVGQTQRIHQTLKQLIHFARPPVPRKEHVDLGGLLSDIIGNLRGLADERQVQLTTDEPPTALTLLVDPGQIRMAISGLVRNGIEAATANGWTRLTVKQDPQSGLTIVVEDSGPGPSPLDCEHLFDPFYSGRKAGRGRGLGLPTAWQLVRQHGGEVRFDTPANGPTRFVLTLPPAAIVEPLPLAAERTIVFPVAQSA